MAAGDTCDLLVIDRGFDAVAPTIHEWTFEAMVADLLAPTNGLFQYDAETQEGQQTTARVPRELSINDAPTGIVSR